CDDPAQGAVTPGGIVATGKGDRPHTGGPRAGPASLTGPIFLNRGRITPYEDVLCKLEPIRRMTMGADIQGLSDSLSAKSQQNQAQNMIKQEELTEQKNAAKTFEQALQAAGT